MADEALGITTPATATSTTGGRNPSAARRIVAMSARKKARGRGRVISRE